MNRIEKKEIAPDASKVFQGEVLSVAPDITAKSFAIWSRNISITRRTTSERKKRTA